MVEMHAQDEGARTVFPVRVAVVLNVRKMKCVSPYPVPRLGTSFSRAHHCGTAVKSYPNYQKLQCQSLPCFAR